MAGTLVLAHLVHGGRAGSRMHTRGIIPGPSKPLRTYPPYLDRVLDSGVRAGDGREQVQRVVVVVGPAQRNWDQSIANARQLQWSPGEVPAKRLHALGPESAALDLPTPLWLRPSPAGVVL